MAFAWTGSEILAWGGCDSAVEDPCVPTAGGFLFDPATWSWHPAPAAPVAGAYADAVQAGDEIIFLGLRDGERLDGEAYDPATGTWRKIADAPVTPPRYGGVQVWTGSEIVVWGGGRADDPTTHEGAAYDPAADTWRLVADAPLGLNFASGMWTGREVLVFGSLLDSGNHADTLTSVGAAYDPATDTWRELPPSALSPQATSAVWVGDRMVAWDYEVHSQEFDPVRNGWSAPTRMPFGFNECYPDSVVTKGLVFAFFCGQVALYDQANGIWHEIHGGPLEDEVQANGASYKLWRFARLAPSGDAVFLAMEGITVGEDYGVCYGCSGSPQSFWLYRAPPELPTA
jgi:hypothetical protein